METKNIKIGLALSGGGVRAAVFHLGVLKKLAAHDLLEKITDISTVSGGSLVTGLIYTLSGNKWPSSTDFLQKIEPGIKEILTNKSLAKDTFWQMIVNLDLLSRAAALGNAVYKEWNVKASLKDIPSTPVWHINSTCFESGKRWRFKTGSQADMGDYQTGYTSASDFKLADAMAASAAFPGLIGPLEIETGNRKWYRYLDYNDKITTDVTDCVKKAGNLHIWDGGVYDNLGLEPLFKIDKQCAYRGDLNFLIVSNASKPFETEDYSSNSALRLLDISGSQVLALRTRIVLQHLNQKVDQGLYLQIGNTAKKILTNSHKFTSTDIEETTSNSQSAQTVQKVAEYPTQLSKISIEDYKDICQHGYEVAEFTMLGYLT